MITDEKIIEIIIKIVCDYFEIAPDNFHSKKRKREIVQTRQVAMYFSNSLTKSSLAAIGAQIGRKDHATVIHACKTVNNLIDTDKKYRNDIENISAIIDSSLNRYKLEVYRGVYEEKNRKEYLEAKKLKFRRAGSIRHDIPYIIRVIDSY